MILLERIDPAINEKRIYTVTVAPVILGEYCVCTGYGRQGEWYKQNPPEVLPDLESAQARAREIVTTKRKRGYKIRSVI